MAKGEEIMANHIERFLKEQCDLEGSIKPKDVKEILVRRWTDEQTK